MRLFKHRTNAYMDSTNNLKTVCVRLVLITLCFVQSTATAASPKSDLELPPQFGTVIIRPWLVFQGSGHPTGILIDLTNALSQQAGIPFRNSIQPHRRIVQSLFAGKVDFAFLIDSPALQPGSERIAHLIELDVVAITLQGQPPIHNIMDLANKRVGVTRGATYGPEINEARHFTRVNVRGPAEGFKLMQEAQLDVLVGTQYSLNQVADDELNVSRQYVLKKNSAGLYISKRSKFRDLIPVYQKALETMRANGSIREIFEQ